MPLSCHGPLRDLRQEVQLSLALAGNPNVGKSSLFNRLTGMGVVTANYPGKTVEVQLGETRFGDRTIGIIDLPGTYALGGISEDQWVARQALLDGTPHAVILVLDATNLARNLYLGLQILDLGLPMVVALNVVDQWPRGSGPRDHQLLYEIDEKAGRIIIAEFGEATNPHTSSEPDVGPPRSPHPLTRPPAMPSPPAGPPCQNPR